MTRSSLSPRALVAQAKTRTTTGVSSQSRFLGTTTLINANNSSHSDGPAFLAGPAFPDEPYEGLIFDCDGTLTDSMPVHFLAWRETMDRHGIEFPEDRFYQLGGMPTHKIIQMLADEQNKKVDAESAAQEKESAFVKRLQMLVPIDPVWQVAAHFRGKLPIAVASGGYREIILQQLRQIGCEGWFDAVITAEDTTRHKPEPDVFLEAARQLGVRPEACLVYEDSDLGVRAAQAASMDVIDIRNFHQPVRVTPVT